MKSKKLAYGMLVIILLIIGVVVLTKKSAINQEISNFDECVKAGYPVLGSYPRMCKITDGRTFTEDLSIVSHGGPVKDYLSLIDNLRANGALVNPSGDISQPFFSIKGQKITVNGDDVQVFEYPDAVAADAEAALVSPDGSSIGTTMVNWVASPHFYKKDKLIVLYVGDTTAIINVLVAVLDPQFAGGTTSDLQQRCVLSPDPGICEAAMPRYYYDQASGCSMFYWGGCGGTVPFQDLSTCQQACE